MDIPTPPNPGRTTQLVLGAVFTGIGAVLLLLGLAQLAFFWNWTLRGLTIEPIVLPVGIGFALFGGIRLRRELDARWLAMHGVDTQAEVLRVEHTKEVVDDQQVICNVALRVCPSGAAPYEITLRWLMGPLDGIRLVPGKHIIVKVDPKNPSRVAPA